VIVDERAVFLVLSVFIAFYYSGNICNAVHFILLKPRTPLRNMHFTLVVVALLPGGAGRLPRPRRQRLRWKCGGHVGARHHGTKLVLRKV
jgi:hypothetical protein